MEKNRINLKDLTSQEQDDLFKTMGEPLYRARQLRKWLYQKHCHNISAMTDFPKALRDKLSQDYAADGLKTVERKVSQDGTIKYLFELDDGLTVETVYITEGKRRTVCVSTQVGCKFRCVFCETGKHGFIRSLRPGEIVNQVIEVNNDSDAGTATNVVLMGMGEPLDNFEPVAQSLKLLNSKEGFGIGKRRITLSTAGVVPGIRRLGELGLGVNLAISLHAADDETRTRLMPINKKYPVRELMKACRDFPLPPQRLITMEVILFDSVNDSVSDAVKLAVALRGVRAKVNLLRFNQVSSSGFTASSDEKIERFMAKLEAKDIPVTLRESRGADIMAACGQLRSASHATFG
ncbi:MAG: 23S rRNA (adenine(2503)-C(2))-methyltransferase RlmN [Nitrospinota bacterium]